MEETLISEVTRFAGYKTEGLLSSNADTSTLYIFKAVTTSNGVLQAPGYASRNG